MNTKILKRIALIAVALTALLVSGCNEDKKLVKKTWGGEVLSAEEITTSFNDDHRTRIKTTEGVFFVSGVISVFIGEPVEIYYYDNNMSFLCFKNKKTCPLIIGN